MSVSELIVGLGQRSYPIRIGKGILKDVGADLAKQNIANRYCIIADDHIAKLYGKVLAASLEKAGLKSVMLTFIHGEASKNLTTFSQLSSELVRNGIDRRDAIIALGGGVTGDLAGFVAATYMRGIPFVQIPTSLLSQVDSSVGGKTGVDIPEGKNLVGAFYQPKAVFIDINVLSSLPREEFVGGMAEVIKYGVIRDKEFFHYLKSFRKEVLSLADEVIIKVIKTCCQIKADVVAEDETESNLRRILNYGHTIGHGVEAVSGFSLIHGKGVAIGMVAAARIAVLKGVLAQSEAAEIEATLAAYDLPVRVPGEFDRDAIKRYLLSDKKTVSGKVTFVLPVKIGEVIITDDVDEGLVDEVLG